MIETMRKCLTLGIISILFILIGSPTESFAKQNSFSITDKENLKTATTSRGFYLLKSSKNDKCDLLAMVGSVANYSWSGWKPVICLESNPKVSLISAGKPYILADPRSKRVYVLVSYVAQNKKREVYHVARAFYSSWKADKWRSFPVAQNKLPSTVYGAGAITGTVYANRLWTAFQRPSDDFERINYQFYFYAHSLNGKRLTKNMTARNDKRLEIDGKYSSLKNNQDAFYLLPQGKKVNLFWTLERANGEQLTYNAAASNITRPSLKFSGQSSALMPGEFQEPLTGVYGVRELSMGDNGRYYFYETKNSQGESLSQGLNSTYTIYRFNHMTANFVPAVIKETQPGSEFKLSTSLMSAGFGVDRSGNYYIADANYKDQDCTLTNYYRYQCWDWTVPGVSNNVITLSKFSPTSGNTPVSELKSSIPFYGEFKPASKLLQWIDSDVGVRRITTNGGLNIISAIGQEGTSAQGAITPVVENRIYQWSINP